MTSIIYTSTKSKKKPKLNAQQRELARLQAEMEARHASGPKFGRGKAPAKAPQTRAKAPTGATVPGVAQQKPATPFSAMVGSTAPKTRVRYTGDNCIGVQLMHKQAYEPVFSKKQAEEITRMRRG